LSQTPDSPALVGPILPRLMPSSETEELAIVGMQAREARELALAADAVGLAVRPLAFGSLLADAAFAAHSPGSVRLPLAIVAGRYSLQRPAFAAVLECIEVVRGARQTLPAACVVLAPTADLDGHEQSAIGLKKLEQVVSSDHQDPATTAHLIRWEVVETEHDRKREKRTT
jgi:hypothetical protein